METRPENTAFLTATAVALPYSGSIGALFAFRALTLVLLCASPPKR